MPYNIPREYTQLRANVKQIGAVKLHVYAPGKTVVLWARKPAKNLHCLEPLVVHLVTVGFIISQPHLLRAHGHQEGSCQLARYDPPAHETLWLLERLVI